MRTRRTPPRLAALAVAAALVAAGCLEDSQATAGPTSTPAPVPTPTVTTYRLATDVWYEGLVLHVGDATASLDERGGTVDVLVTIENPGAEDSALDAVISLVVGGTRIAPTRESRVPLAPAGEQRLALLSFELQGIPSVAAAALEIGASPDHVARVPFGPQGGDTVTLAPRRQDLAGESGAAGDLRLTLRSLELRWDLPDWSLELPADLRALTLTYDATYNGAFTGGFAFTGENVALRLPDGTVVGPRRDGHSQSVELIGARKTKKQLFSRFEIPADAIGEFALLVRNGSRERAIVFTVEG